MTTKDILKEEFELLAIDLVSKHKELGMKASGNWINSLEVSIKDNTGNYKASILGAEYTEQLEFGRKKGKFPPIHFIKEWIQKKGLTYDIPLNSLAFLIARKISREGWKREKHGGVELVSKVITPKRIDEIIQRIGIEMTVKVSELLIDTYKHVS